jgi:putative DNA primase/helicase
LATEYGVTGWPPGEAIKAAAAGFAAWRSLRGKGNLERDQVVERMVGFIERHGDSRFSDADSDDDQRAAMVRDRAGWWKDTDAGRRYLFTAEGMREAMKGFDFNRALDALQELDSLTHPARTASARSFTGFAGRGLKLYSVNPAALDVGRLTPWACTTC